MAFFTQVMIAMLLGLGAVGLFNRRPLVLHGLVMALYVFRYELTNKITFMILICWLTIYLLRTKNIGDRKGLIILVCGLSIFSCRGLSYFFYGIGDASLIFRDVVVGYVNAVIWAYLAFSTIKDFRGLMTIVGIYALMRTVESGIGGLLLYHYPDTALQFVFEKRELSVEAETTLTAFSRDERLMSLSGMNPVDTSFHLAISILLFLSRIYNKVTILDIVAVLVCAASLLYTWSRTGWLGLVVGIAIYSILTFSSGAWKKYAFALLLLGALLFSEADNIKERYYTDGRNLGESTVTLRIILQQQYLTKITEYGLFGIGLPNPKIPAYLNINPPISSESMFISAFVETGWLGGAIFAWFMMYGLLLSYRSLLQARRGRQIHPEYYIATAMLFTVFVIIILMSLTFYLSWSDPISWLFIGLIFTLQPSKISRQYDKIRMRNSSKIKQIYADS